MSKTSHYKATTKRGFEAGELAGLLASHSPNADYKVVISFRGKVRELIVDEEEVHVLLREAAQQCETPADDQRHGGKLEATFHGTAATYPPGELTDEALNARFGDPRLSNLDSRDGLRAQRPASEKLLPEDLRRIAEGLR